MSAPNARVLLGNGEDVETVWAETVGPNLYRLENSPFWAYGVSWHDVVEAFPDESGQLVMSRVISKSGHRTIRVFFETGVNAAPEGQAALDDAVRLGCSYEGMNPLYLAIDIPPGETLAHVTERLNARNVQWEYADPTYDDVVKGGFGAPA